MLSGINGQGNLETPAQNTHEKTNIMHQQYGESITFRCETYHRYSGAKLNYFLPLLALSPALPGLAATGGVGLVD